jgi:hypothetical protein
MQGIPALGVIKTASACEVVAVGRLAGCAGRVVGVDSMAYWVVLWVVWPLGAGWTLADPLGRKPSLVNHHLNTHSLYACLPDCSGQIGFMICSKKAEGEEPLDPREPRLPVPAHTEGKGYPPLR